MIYIGKTNDQRSSGFFLNTEYVYVAEKFTDESYCIVFAYSNITSWTPLRLR